jgi:pilus assembly protein Flp/PilA
MKSFKQMLSNLVVEESGQDLIEYALVACLIGVVAIVAMTSVGTAIKAAFNSIATTITTAI